MHRASGEMMHGGIDPTLEANALYVEQSRLVARLGEPSPTPLVVWDVDLVGADVVRVFRPASAEPSIYRRGDVAEAEPAVPGWRAGSGSRA